MSSNGQNAGEEHIVAPIADGREYEILLGETFRNGLESSNKLFHTLQYSWKPTSINEEERGVLQYELDAELVAEYKNKGSDEVWLLHGQFKRCKETECVLIFDGKTFTLERLSGLGMVKPTKTKTSHIPATMPTIQAQRKEKRSLSDSDLKATKTVKKRKVEPVQNGAFLKEEKQTKAGKNNKPTGGSRKKVSKNSKQSNNTKTGGQSSDSDLDLVSQLEQGLDEVEKEEVIEEEIEEEMEEEELEGGTRMAGVVAPPAKPTTTATLSEEKHIKEEEEEEEGARPVVGGKGLAAIALPELPTLIENNVLRSPLSESSSDNDSSDSDSESESPSESDDLFSASSSQSSSDSESDSESD